MVKSKEGTEQNWSAIRMAEGKGLAGDTTVHSRQPSGPSQGTEENEVPESLWKAP